MMTPYSPSEIPIKLVSREISSSQEFREKWVGKDAAIAIIGLWNGSGVPQKKFSQMMLLIAAVPMMVDVFIVFQEGESSIDCARELLAASEKSHVVYDSTSTFESIYPPDSFELEEDATDADVQWGDELPLIRYAGPPELIPKIVTDAYASHAIMASEDKICHLESDGERSWHRREKLEPSTAKRYIEAMSCGMISIPSRAELGIDWSGNEDEETFRKLMRSFASHEMLPGRCDFAFPVPSKVQEYMDAMDDAKKAASAIRKIWERAMGCTPFLLEVEHENLDEFVSNLDPAVIKSIAEATGAYHMIDAYMGGVPLEDILA